MPQAQSSLLACLLFGFLLVFGGSGSLHPRPELLVQLISAAMVGLWLVLAPTRNAWRNVPRSAWLIIALVGGLGLVQLIPLPPFIWHSLPGRGLEREALALVGQDGSWRPISMWPERTLASWLCTLPPLAMLAMAAALERQDHIRLVAVAALIALASLVAGALQLTGGEASPAHFYNEVRPVITGFQADHNATVGLFLAAMIGVPLLVAEAQRRGIVAPGRKAELATAGAALAVLTLGLVLTASRAGIILLPLALGPAIWLLRPWAGLEIGRRHMAFAAAGLGAAGLLAVLLVRNNPALNAVAARFDFSNEVRPQIWIDAAYVARKYLPFGAGMGSFPPALMIDERLEAVREFYSNRADNEYLELTIEAGLLGLGVLALAVREVVRAGRNAWRAGHDGDLGIELFAIGILAVFALHALVDFMLRTMANTGLVAVGVAILLVRGRTDSRSGVDD